MRRDAWRVVLSILIIVSVAAGVTACGSDGDSSGGNAGGDTPDKPKVVVILKDNSSSYWLKAKEGAERAQAEFADEADITITAGTKDGDAPSQITKIENAVTQGAKGIVISPSAADPLKPVLERAVAQGVKVVLFDTDIPDMEGESSFVSTDNKAAGATAGTHMIELLGGKGTVAVMGAIGASSVEDREAGFREALQGSGVEIVTRFNAQCDAAKSVSSTENLLTSHADIDGVFAVCGPAATGTAQALAKAGVSISQVRLVGFDASSDEAADILADRESATIAQYPDVMAELGIGNVLKAIAGETVPEFVPARVSVVTKENAADFQ